MTNSFSVSKLLAVVTTVLAVGGLGAAAISAGASAVVVAPCMMAALVAMGFLTVPKRSAAMDVSRALAVCKEIQAGNFEARITDIRETGDLGELFWAINDIIDRSDAFLRESAASMDHVARNLFYRRITETGMVGAFLVSSKRINTAIDSMTEMVAMSREVAERVTTIIGSVSTATTQLETTARTMQGAADNTSKRAREAAEGAEQASTNVGTVASVAEELTASISEIGQQVTRSSDITQTAVQQTEETTRRVERLSQAAARIGDIVELITTIASQTNLLALNATIEAARAGEAGRGFGVVAQEVKVLAGQTAQATQEITGQVNAIRSALTETVAGVEDIGKTVDEVSAIATAIATAIEEQSIATKEIAASAGRVSTGAADVTRNITEVMAVADETDNDANRVLGAAGDLSREADSLAQEMNRLMDLMNRAA